MSHRARRLRKVDSNRVPRRAQRRDVGRGLLLWSLLLPVVFPSRWRSLAFLILLVTSYPGCGCGGETNFCEEVVEVEPCTAPVTAIVAWDPLYWQRLDFLFPHEDRKPLFDGRETYAYDTAYRNSTLQGGYMMIAARALGLDVGAMSGFSNAIVDEEFFSENGWKSNFLINMGYADETALFQKLPRFDFEDVCQFL